MTLRKLKTVVKQIHVMALESENHWLFVYSGCVQGSLRSDGAGCIVTDVLNAPLLLEPEASASLRP